MSRKQAGNKINWVHLALAIFVGYQVALWIAWVIPSRHYVGFDEGWHLEVSQYIYRGLTDYGIPGLIYKFIHAFQDKPPLISFLPVPMYLIFGNHVWAATAVNLIWLVLLNVYLFRLVCYFWGEGPALIACISLQTMPLFPGLSRFVMAEYGTAVLVIMFMYYLFVPKPSAYRAVCLGVVAGLGSLEKVLFPTYIIGPLILVIVGEFWKAEKGSRSRMVRFWLLSLGIALLVAGPWYSVNYAHVLGRSLRVSYGAEATPYRFGTSLGDLKAIGLYVRDFINSGITAYQALLLALSWLGYRIIKGKGKHNPISLLTIGIILWFVVPFLIYLPSLYLNYKFMIPFFPPVSIALGVVLWRFVENCRWSWLIVAAILIWPNFNILYAGVPLGKLNQTYRTVRLGPFDFLPDPYLGFPKPDRFPYKEILEFVASDGACIKGSTGGPPSLAMAVDMSEFNRNAMIFEVTRTRLPVKVYGAPLGGSPDPSFDLAAALSIAAKQDYIIFRSINPAGPEFTNKFNGEIRKRIESGELPFRLLKAFPLPDGSSGLLYRQISQSERDDCAYHISPASQIFGKEAGKEEVSVTTCPGKAWTASTHSESWDWIGISSGGSGTGSGTVNYYVLSNKTGRARTGTLTIAGRLFTITQIGESLSDSQGAKK